MSECFAYDGRGSLIEHTDFNGTVQRLEYDSRHRVVRKQLANGARVEETTFGYTPAGMLRFASNALGTVAFTFDARNRLAEITYPDGGEIRYGYNERGDRVQMETADGAIHYSYNAAGQLSAVEDRNGGVTEYEYTAAGLPSRTTQPNGVTTVRDYNEANQLMRLRHLRADGNLFSSFDYTLGPTGHRLGVAEHSGRTAQYEYDELFRLVGETVESSAGTEHNVRYRYDASGNLAERQANGESTVFEYDANQRLVSENGSRLEYDLNGNLLAREDGEDRVHYQYDLANRLIAVEKNGVRTSFGYDALGHRIESRMNGEIRRYLIDPNGDFSQVVEERDSEGRVLASYVRGRGLISRNSPEGDDFYLTDGLGSVRALTSSQGEITAEYDYDAYGRTLAVSGNSRNPYRFAGEWQDAETDLYNLRARYYDPAMGRFTTRDRWPGILSQPGSLNQYAYAYNDPVNFVDPSGCFGLAESMMVVADLGSILSIMAPTLLKGTVYIVYTAALIRPAAHLRNLGISAVIEATTPYWQGSSPSPGDPYGDEMLEYADKMFTYSEAFIGLKNKLDDKKVLDLFDQAIDDGLAVAGYAKAFANAVPDTIQFNEDELIRVFQATDDTGVSVATELAAAARSGKLTMKVVPHASRFADQLSQAEQVLLLEASRLQNAILNP